MRFTTALVALVLTAGCRQPEQEVDAPEAEAEAPPAEEAAPEAQPAATGMDHSAFLPGPFEDATAVTTTCLGCHPDSAKEVMADSHWNWSGHEVAVQGGGTRRVGKATVINNFCLGTAPNMAMCSQCHAGYGWKTGKAPPDDPSHVDCLVCHADPKLYKKGHGGWPAENVDLVAAAGSVGDPTRGNCGQCHFSGGGGDGVKHGDLDSSLVSPKETTDVHMGRLGFECQTCHQTEHHSIPGCSLGVCTHREERLACESCHADTIHSNPVIERHTESIACQSCHIPSMAIEVPTKMHWDWSEAGQDREEDPHVYMKKKGSFRYAQDIRPSYRWYDCEAPASRHLIGDKVTPGEVVQLNDVCGDPRSPTTKLWPVKIHTGKQPYDTENIYLLVPKLVGEDGYWTTFDWDQSFRLAEPTSGLAYSGSYDFIETEMVWPLSHMARPKTQALECAACHDPEVGLDWASLGYEGNPVSHIRHDDEPPVRMGFSEGQGMRPTCKP